MRTFFVMALGLILNPLLHSQSCLPTGITFTAQSQVDQFPIAYPGCVHVLGSLTVLGAGITNLDSLYNLEQVDGDLYITNNENLLDINGLQQLERVGGAMRLQGNPLMEHLDGLTSLRVIAGDYFYIGNNTQLKNTDGTAALDSIMGLFHLWANDSLLDLDGFNALHYVGDNLNIFNNPQLLSITGFEALAHIVGALRLTDHPLLADISAFDHPISIKGALVITDNPQLGECDVASVCNYLEAPASFIAISGNGVGCQSVEEVEVECLNNSINYVDDTALVLYPNPVYEELFLQLPSHLQGGVNVWNCQGQLMASYKEAPASIIVGEWPQGTYWIKWQASTRTEIRTFIKQ